MEDEGYSYLDDHLELQDGKNATGHKENEVQNVSSPSLLGKGPSLLGRGPNTENGDHSYPDDHPGIGQRHRPVRSTHTGPVTYSVDSPGHSKIQHLPLHLHTTNYGQQNAGSSVDKEVLKSVKKNSQGECQNCSTKEDNNKDCPINVITSSCVPYS